MNADTTHAVKDILKNGYHRKGITLGEGGWPFLYSQGLGDWHTYLLLDKDCETVEQITAKDDSTAIKAFSELYHLDMLPGYEILEKVTEFRTVQTESRS